MRAVFDGLFSLLTWSWSRSRPHDAGLAHGKVSSKIREAASCPLPCSTCQVFPYHGFVRMAIPLHLTWDYNKFCRNWRNLKAIRFRVQSTSKRSECTSYMQKFSQKIRVIIMPEEIFVWRTHRCDRSNVAGRHYCAKLALQLFYTASSSWATPTFFDPLHLEAAKDWVLLTGIVDIHRR